MSLIKFYLFMSIKMQNYINIIYSFLSTVTIYNFLFWFIFWAFTMFFVINNTIKNVNSGLSIGK